MAGRSSHIDADGDSSDAGLDAKLDRAVAAGEAEAFLLGIGGEHDGRVYPLIHNTIYLGRADDADVPIVDPSVSGRHARIINGAQGFEIEDLGSTNGTVVEGRKVSRARLRSGDRISLGHVAFKFLLDKRIDATMAIIPAGIGFGARAGHSGNLIRYEPPRARETAPFVPAQRRNEDEGPSLQEIIGRMARAYRFLQRNARLLGIFAAVGAVLGVISALVLPAPRQAVCVVKLQPQVKANPVDAQWNRAPSEDQEVRFFASAETAFIQPELVSRTLTKMLGKKPDPAVAASVSERLKLESVHENVYRASYSDRLIGAGPVGAADFLSAHIDNYLHDEIARALRVFTAQADFLRNQLKSVETDLTTLSDQKMRFRERNADRLPEEAGSVLGSRYTLETRRAELLARIRQLQGELEAQRHALAEEGPLAQSRYKTSEAYRESLAGVNRKLTEAYSRGLTDEHPDIRQLKDEKERIEALIKNEMAAKTDPLDRESNAGYQELKSKVALLAGQLSAARSDLADTEESLNRVQKAVGDLPRVQAGVQQLTHMQDATTQLHSQLFEQLKKAELQLNLERVSAESRYEVISAPHLVTDGRARTIVIRLLVGAVAGILLALMTMFVREGQRLFTHALSNLESQSGTWAR